MHAPVLWGLKEEKKIEVYSYRKKVKHRLTLRTFYFRWLLTLHPRLSHNKPISIVHCKVFFHFKEERKHYRYRGYKGVPLRMVHTDHVIRIMNPIGCKKPSYACVYV